uniref:NADH-ubiquinone oxidoreductase chain 5 n=1 Tax=Pnyxia scabiei TaxID=1781627 RepID=A0A7L9R583_9DIPT|nr:NADH dehydrogenase subunit 5 [Pnyxia scabiei]QOL10547.1 NADH dehydrogenase subunit 5 [Pnyxia scabiei]
MKIISINFISFIWFILMSFLSFLFSIYFFCEDLVYFLEWEVVSLHSCMIVMTLLFDWMGCLFISFVLMISGLVILYSMSYMASDSFTVRFIMLILMFVFSMMLLIMSPNLISILLGWDGLGLVSYGLVIYFQNVKSYSAGMLTVLSNRIGDVGILLSIAWMLNYGSWNYVFYLNFMKGDSLMMVIMFFIMIAGMTKSAQVPFSSWLPAAMAAPTPVSALVHSSTLVTAGVYLLIRFNIFLCDNLLGQIMLLISGITMLLSGVGANFEFDLKKIIALSTLSQLGLMMMILSMGYPKLAFFHLLTHAMFKALLFMCAGAIIHNLMDFQDIRFMGAISSGMPLTSTFFNIANLALSGAPFLAGFYSKDLILELSCFSSLNGLIFFFFFFSTGLTVSYSFRLVYYSMVGDFNSLSINLMINENWLMLKSMMFLVLFSIFSGSFLMWLIFPSPYMICLPYFLKLMTLFVCFMGAISGYFISVVSLQYMNKSLRFISLVSFFSLMWFLPILSTLYINKFILMMCMNVMKNMDQGWSEFFGAQNLFYLLIYSSKFNELVNLNSLKIYLMGFFFLMIVLFLMII